MSANKFSIGPSRRKVMCVLIAAHNEELVIASTINSVIASGMDASNIYIVDDNSSDRTSFIARNILPRSNVMKVRRSGKGLALQKASKRFGLTSRYRWIHIADADCVFARDYFTILRKNIRVSNAAATGYVKSLPGKRVSEFRAYEYTLGMELHRRLQNVLGVIPIIPGPTSCFRWDVFDKLDFNTKALTEDSDVTLQIYRQKLGRIQFIPQAVVCTQDPLTLKSYINQILRWNRGVLQSISRHNIGLRLHRIDAYLQYQIIQSLLMATNIFIWVPYVVVSSNEYDFLAMVFLLDVALTACMALFAVVRSGRKDILAAFPIVYAFKWINLLVFIRAYFEVIILRKFRVSSGLWENGAARRYKITQTV